MRHLTRHLAPRPLTLGLRHLFAGLGKVMDHQVVGPHQTGNLILLIVNDVFQSRSPGVYHLASHVNNRAEHFVYHSCSEEPGDNQQYEEHRHHEYGVEYRICLERKSGISIWCAQDCHDLALVIENRRVHGVETLAAETLLVDVVSLVVIHDVPVRLVIGPGTDNHVFENLRCRGVEHFAARTVQSYVGPGVVSDIVDNG